MASAAAVKAVGGFDETLTHLEDWDMWLRLVRRGPAAKCDDALVAYVMHSKNRHLGVHDFMGEFDRFAAKHTAWAADIGLTFDRALFARYPATVMRVLGYRRAAYWHILRHGLFPVTRKHVRSVAGFVLGERVVRAYRRPRQHDLEADLGPLAEDPAWLDAFRGGELHLTARRLMRLPGGVVMQPPGSPDSGRSSRRTGFQRVDGRSRVGMTTLTWASGQAAGHRCTEGRAPHLTAPVRGREHGPDGGKESRRTGVCVYAPQA